MNLIDRILVEIRKIEKRGDIPTIIWLGIQEKYELQKLGNDICRKPYKENMEKQIMGLPYHFVSSDNWLTVSYEEKG